MSTVLAYPAGAPCWLVIGGQLTRDLGDPAAGCRPQRLPRPCVTITCDGCGACLDNEDAGWPMHLPGGRDPDLSPFGWAGDGAGRHYCGCPDTPSPAELDGVDRRPRPYDAPLPWEGPS